MDRTKIPSASFEWYLGKGVSLTSYPLNANGVLVWAWSIDYNALPIDLIKKIETFQAPQTPRGRDDTPKDSIESLSEEQDKILGELIAWVEGER